MSKSRPDLLIKGQLPKQWDVDYISGTRPASVVDVGHCGVVIEESSCYAVTVAVYQDIFYFHRLLALIDSNVLLSRSGANERSIRPGRLPIPLATDTDLAASRSRSRQIRDNFTSMQKRIDVTASRARECMWKEGLIRKVPNLCHGGTSNAFVSPPGPQRDYFLAYGTSEKIREGKDKVWWTSGDCGLPDSLVIGSRLGLLAGGWRGTGKGRVSLVIMM